MLYMLRYFFVLVFFVFIAYITIQGLSTTKYFHKRENRLKVMRNAVIVLVSLIGALTFLSLYMNILE